MQQLDIGTLWQYQLHQKKKGCTTLPPPEYIALQIGLLTCWDAGHMPFIQVNNKIVTGLPWLSFLLCLSHSMHPTIDEPNTLRPCRVHIFYTLVYFMTVTQIIMIKFPLCCSCEILWGWVWASNGLRHNLNLHIAMALAVNHQMTAHRVCLSLYSFLQST